MPRLVTLIALFGFLVFGIFLYYHKSPIQIDDFDPNFACHDVEKETIAKLAVLSSFRIVDKSQMQKLMVGKMLKVIALTIRRRRGGLCLARNQRPERRGR